jgi:hypothetical protein
MSSNSEMTDFDASEDEQEDIERGGFGCKKEDDDERVVLCDENDEHAHVYLKLPVLNACNGTQRAVDAHCAICVSGYEEGDTVVWSGLECRHAFHDQCILPWLAKGKKRCPICRHWFVPGAKIDDQKKALEERLEREESSSSAETELTNNVSSSDTSSEGEAAAVAEVDDQPPQEQQEGDSGKNDEAHVDDQSLSEHWETNENFEEQSGDKIED